jgi:hypothetical protein
VRQITNPYSGCLRVTLLCLIKYRFGLSLYFLFTYLVKADQKLVSQYLGLIKGITSSSEIVSN